MKSMPLSAPVVRILGVAILLAGAVTAHSAPGDGAGAADPQRRAGDACEAAVAEAVREARGRAALDIRFIGGQRALSGSPGEDTGVKGEGRYLGATGPGVPFTYTCAFNHARGATHGVLFSDKGGAAAQVAPVEAQIDLARLSPDACEAAAAADLKVRHPRVDRIVFGSDSRALRGEAQARTALEGRGALARAPGMNAVPFSYRCEFDNRSGRVVGVTTRD